MYLFIYLFFHAPKGNQVISWLMEAFDRNKIWFISTFTNGSETSLYCPAVFF